jgi:hypothetical protein
LLEWFIPNCRERLNVTFKFNDKANGRSGSSRQGSSATVFIYGKFDMDREVIPYQDDPAKELHVITVPM